MGHEKNKLKKLPEEIGKGLNKEHYAKVKKAREEMTVCQIRCTVKQKQDIERASGHRNVSNITRILWDKYVKGEIE